MSEKELCWKCEEYLRQKYGPNFYQAPSNHCHHLPKEKEKFRSGDLVIVKVGSTYGQDFSFNKWIDVHGTVFKIDQYIGDEGKFKLTAPGYGEKGNYGNGSIYVYEKDLIAKEKEKCRCFTDSAMFHYWLDLNYSFCHFCGRKL